MKNKLLIKTESALKKAGIHYTIEDKAFTFGIKGDDCNFDVVIFCNEEKEMLTTLVACSLIVSPIKLYKMCRWIANRNLEIACGCFQLDTSVGKLYFRLTCPVNTKAINVKFVERVYSTAISTFNFFYDDIVKALYFENTDENDSEMILSESREEPEYVKEHRIYS